MDKASQLCMMANTEVLKEPRGFIKFIEFILAICAFATTTAYYGSTDLTYRCENLNGTVEHLEARFSYPFNLKTWSPDKAVCDNHNMSMRNDFTHPSQFYVFVGVMAFLYSLSALILYVFADDKYRQIDNIPAADLVITVIFVLLWLIASSAWADGVRKLKSFTTPEYFYFDGIDIKKDVIVSYNEDSFASLNVSIIFGFLNMCVWGGNIWFLYKETKWFSGPPDNQQQTQSGSQENPQQRI
jgi:hypothetical protein